MTFGYLCQKLPSGDLPSFRSNSITSEDLLSVFNQNDRIHAMALQKMLGQKKVFQIQPKSSQVTSTDHNRMFFNQPMPMGGLPQVSRRLLGKIWILARFAKRTRIAAASTSSSFLSHLKCLMMLFLVARMTRLGF